MKKSFLIDFHVHTNYSDGSHSLREIVDLYGRQGFGAIAITDHICETKTFLGRAAHRLQKTLTPETFTDYIKDIQAEADRALHLYDMLVIPGYELTKNSWLNHRSAHILGIGTTTYRSADADLADSAAHIREQGGIAIAAHPVWTRRLEKQTYHLWDKREKLSDVFDAWEVASGPHLFREVQESRLPMIASSDLHHRSQLSSWKTGVRCEKNGDDILNAVRKQNIDFVFYEEQALDIRNWDIALTN